HGQVTSVPTTIPSESGPPRWVQVSSIAWNFPSTLKSAIFFPPASTNVPSPGAISPALATLTNSAIAHLLVVIILAFPFGRTDVMKQLHSLFDRAFSMRSPSSAIMFSSISTNSRIPGQVAQRLIQDE